MSDRRSTHPDRRSHKTDRRASDSDRQTSESSDRTPESYQRDRRPSLVRRSSTSEKVEYIKEISGTEADKRRKSSRSPEKDERKSSIDQKKDKPSNLQKGSSEQIGPTYSHPEIKKVKSPQGYYVEEPVRIERRQSFSKDVNAPRPEGYYEKEPVRIERRQSFSKDVNAPRPEGYYEKEPVRIERRQSFSKDVNAPRSEGYYEKEPVRIERRQSFSKDVNAPRSEKYSEKEPALIEKRLSFSKSANTRDTTQYEEIRAKRNERDEKKPEEDEKKSGVPCKPCSAEGGFHRVEVRVYKSEDDSESEDETNVKWCDNKLCPNKGGYNNTYGGQTKSQKTTRRRKYGDDTVYLCDNAECPDRSSRDFPGKLALCGKNTGNIANIIDFCGNNLKLIGSSKEKSAENARGSNRNRKKKQTICVSDPEILEQLYRSKWKSEVDDTENSSKVEITEVGSDKKFIFFLNPDALETSSSSHRKSDSQAQSICYCVPDSSSEHERGGESNEGGLSALLMILIILLLVYLYYPSHSSSRFFC